MDDENYFDSPEDSPEPQQGEEGEEQGEQSSQESFLVAKTSFPNAQPGDEIRGRVVRVMENEIEVEPLEGEETEEGSGEPAMAGADGPSDDDMMA
jgi:hypothetical protein